MAKEDKQGKKQKQALSRVYREFSRQKYSLYKAQFPKIRQSEVVQKIIKEWDALDIVAKKNLQKLYEEKNYLTAQDISSSEALMRAEQTRKEQLQASKEATLSRPIKSLQPAPTKIIPAEAGPKSDSEYNRPGSERIESKGDSSSPALVIEPFQRKVVEVKDKYVDFFKIYYEKLSKEHPKWTATQITSVVKLLWKKRKNQTKAKKIQKISALRKTTATGYVFFRRQRRLNAQQTKEIWRGFPLQTRKYWKLLANGQSQRATLQYRKPITLPSQVHQLSFLFKAVV